MVTTKLEDLTVEKNGKIRVKGEISDLVEEMEEKGEEVKEEKKPSSPDPITLFTPGEGKGKVEGFEQIEFQFVRFVKIDPVFAAMRAAAEEVKRMKKQKQFLQSNEGIILQAVVFLADGNMMEKIPHLRIIQPTLRKRGFLDEKDNFIASEEVVKKAKEKIGSSSIKTIEKKIVILEKARFAPHKKEGDREKKINDLLQLCGGMKKEELKNFSSIEVMVAKRRNERMAEVFSPSLGGAKIANILYIGYDEKSDGKKRYMKMTPKPYQDTKWDSQQPKLRVLTYDVDGRNFSVGRQNGLFVKNLKTLLSQCHKIIKKKWKPAATIVSPMDEFKFIQSVCDERVDGLHFKKRKGEETTKLFLEKKKIGEIGTKEITCQNNKIILTNWDPVNPEGPFNKWQEVATKHVQNQIS